MTSRLSWQLERENSNKVVEIAWKFEEYVGNPDDMAKIRQGSSMQGWHNSE